MRSESPFVSVVIPTYDRPAMLIEAVASLSRQTYRDFEVLVVDDASPTPANEPLDGVSTDPPIRVLEHAENRGANAARNTGISAANGEVLAFLDDDDRWHPEKLERQIQAFERGSPSLGVVLVGQRFVDDRGTTIREKYPEMSGSATASLFAGNIAGPFSTMAVRRSVIDDAGLPDERLPSLQDREWLIRLSHHCTFESIRQPLVFRRMGDHAQIGDRFVDRRDHTYRLMLEKHRDTAARYGLEGPFQAGLARGVAGSALRAGVYDDARRFAWRAIRAEPTSIRAYSYLIAAIGGGLTYRSARRIKHHVGRIVHG